MFKSIPFSVLNWLGEICLIFILGKLIFSLLNTMEPSLAYSIPNEYRDGAMIYATDAIAHGINPYTVSGMESNTTPILYLYAGLNPFLAAILQVFLGISSLAAHYMLNFIYVAISTYFFWRITNKYIQVNKILLLAMTLIFTTTIFTLFDGSPVLFNIHTDGSAVCIYFIILYLMTKNNANCAILSFFSILLFFTKQIECAVVFPIFIYLYIFDKFSAKRYLIYCIIMTVCTVLALEFFAPLYLTATVLYQFACVAGEMHFKSALINLFLFVKRYFLPCSVTIILFIFLCKQNKFNILKETQGRLRYIYALIIQIMVSIFFLLYLAQNGGDGYKYVQDMLAPSVILLSFIGTEIIANIISTKYIKIKEREKEITVFLLLLITLTSFTHFKFSYYSELAIKEYDSLQKVLKSVDDDKIFLGPAVNFYVIGKTSVIQNADYDNGQIEYFRLGEKAEKYKENIRKMPFIHVDEVQNIHDKYVEKINQRVLNQYYDIICGGSAIIDSDILEANYVQIDSYTVHNAHQYWNVPIWIPRIK